VKQIFTERQRVAVEGAVGEIDWQPLRPYGPVERIQVWKKVKAPSGLNLTVERWHLPAHSGTPAAVLLKVSAKVPLARKRRHQRKLQN
jgi:hypothetical protein